MPASWAPVTPTTCSPTARRVSRKEAEVTRKAPSESPTGGDIRQGFVYERVPHITLKSIANNAEIDVIWERWQETLEPLREELNAALGTDMGGVGDPPGIGRSMARTGDRSVERASGGADG